MVGNQRRNENICYSVSSSRLKHNHIESISREEEEKLCDQIAGGNIAADKSDENKRKKRPAHAAMFMDQIHRPSEVYG